MKGSEWLACINVFPLGTVSWFHYCQPILIYCQFVPLLFMWVLRSFDLTKDEHPAKFVLQKLTKSRGVHEAVYTWLNSLMPDSHVPHPSEFKWPASWSKIYFGL